MKAFLTVAIFCIILSVALATSPMRCDNTCDPDLCYKEDTPCQCGTYKDQCQCCDLCYRCPGEQCNPLAGELCVGDKVCEVKEGENIWFGAKGTC